MSEMAMRAPLFIVPPSAPHAQPVVGVFDLGARAFEGIRNASRIDDDSDSDDRGPDGPTDANDVVRNSGGSRNRQSSLSSHQQQQQMPSSPRPMLGVIMENSGETGGCGGGVVGLLSFRARPPRMFGPLGEMEPFTWESAVAQAIMRAVMRDDGDVPLERYCTYTEAFSVRSD